jgi:hypothetical protein
VPERRDGRSGPSDGLTTAGSDFLQLVVDYAKQETLEPIKGVGQFVAFGVAGSVVLSLGTALLLLALLRLLQGETGSAFTGNLSWLPYLITAVVAVAVAGLATWRVTRGAAKRTAPDHTNRRP